MTTMMPQVYCNPEAVDDDLVELLYRPSCDEGAIGVFVSVLTGDCLSPEVLNVNSIKIWLNGCWTHLTSPDLSFQASLVPAPGM